MSRRRALTLISLGLALPSLSAAATPRAPGEATSAGAVAPSHPVVQGHLDLSQTVGIDDHSARQIGFSDLRAVLDARRLFDAPLGFGLDGRARLAWNAWRAHRLKLTQAYVRLGDASTSWRGTLGRQLVPALANTEVDGLSVEYQATRLTSASVFGGLMPHPLNRAFTKDFALAGFGLDSRGDESNQAGGAAVALYRGKLDRLYASHRGFWAWGRTLNLSTLALFDFLAPRPLIAFGDPPTTRGGIDPTVLNLSLRLRPTPWLESSLLAAHNHTVLPSRWWADYWGRRQQELGFALDGAAPAGTRLTGVRWTNSFLWIAELAPYVRLRYERRHSDNADHYEGRVGLKWRPAWGYVHLAYAYRDYFGTPQQVGEASLGVDSAVWGLDAGLTLLSARARDRRRARLSTTPYASLWGNLGALSSTLDRLHLLAQYEGFVEPDLVAHTFFVQVGYRL